MVFLRILECVVVMLFFGASVFYWRRNRRLRMENAEEMRTDSMIDGTPDEPIGFGYKCKWLAIRGDSPQLVAHALGAEAVQACNWKSAAKAIYGEGGRRVFISPPIHGWVLIAGNALPTLDVAERADQATSLMKTLGRTFEDVQYFATHRVVGYHAWARVLRGEIVRCFAYLGERGEILYESGVPDVVEQALRKTNREEWKDESAEFSPSEDDVMAMAGAWSIDPTQLEDLGLPASAGLVMEMP